MTEERMRSFGVRMSRRTFMGSAVAATGAAGLAAGGWTVPALAKAASPQRSSVLDTVWGWLPSPAATPGSLLTVDTSGIGADTLAALAVLQGLVNTRMVRGEQAVYLVIPPTPNNYPEGKYNLWPSIYAGQAGLGVSQGGAADIAALAVARGVKQYVIWDPSLSATMNVATTLAWLHGTAAFSPADAATSLTNGMSLFLDLSKAGFTSDADAYTWALRQVADQAPQTLALLSDGGPDGYLPGAVAWTPRDYAVHARAFTWIADLGASAFAGQADTALIDNILGAVGDGTRTMFGWSNNESATTILASQTGINFVGADTPGLPSENLTVHNAVRTQAVQRPRPAAPKLETDVVYACVVFTDGDNIGVLIQFHEGRWQDPSRGQVPVGWSMQGMAPAWTPGLARHYFQSASDNDELVGWLPFGYPDLPTFVGKPHWQEWVASAQAAMAGAGLGVSQNLPHTGGVLDERASGWWDLLHGDDAPAGHIVGYTGPIGSYPVGEALWINGRPVLPVAGGSGSTPSAAAAAGVSGAAAANQARPLFVVTGLANGTTYEDAIALVQSSFDVPVRFVLPGQLIELQRQAWERGLAGTTLLGVASSGSAEFYFLPLGEQGSQAVLFRQGDRLTQARQLSDGGLVTYTFNVEHARSADLTLQALGQGTVEISNDGQNWQHLVDIDAPSGQYAEVTTDLSAPLPAAHLWLRFTAGAQATLTAVLLRIAYNRPRRPTKVSLLPLPGGATIVGYPTLTAAKATSVPPLDGTVAGQWTTAEQITVTPSDPTVQQFGMVWDVPPQGGTVSALWDADHLYVLAQIQDDNIMAPDTTSATGAPWLDDGLAIYLSYGTWGFKVAATVPTASGSSLVYYQDGTSTSTAGNAEPNADAAQVGYLQTTSGYNLALAIPWNELQGFTGQAGLTLRFTPLILDRQGTSSSDWGQVMWCGDDDNPQVNGYLILGS